jgi:small subunit ribosomal protein S2
MKEDGTAELLPKKEVILLEREHRKLMRGLGGIRQMTALPAAIFIVDILKEQTALKEARRLGIPVVAIVDTNTDPDEIDYPVPGNDDAIRSIKLLTSIVASAVLAGREMAKPIEERSEEIATPLEVEEAETLTMEEHLENTVLSQVIVPKEEGEDEKRTGF